MLIKTDNELMQDLVNRYVTSVTIEEKLAILADLEFYVHQYDNGIYFCDIKGFELLVTELNNTQELGLQLQIPLVLSAVFQSNPKVQIHALKFDFLHVLVNKLGHSDHGRIKRPVGPWSLCILL